MAFCHPWEGTQSLLQSPLSSHFSPLCSSFTLPSHPFVLDVLQKQQALPLLCWCLGLLFLQILTWFPSSLHSGFRPRSACSVEPSLTTQSEVASSSQTFLSPVVTLLPGSYHRLLFYYVSCLSSYWSISNFRQGSSFFLFFFSPVPLYSQYILIIVSGTKKVLNDCWLHEKF